MLLIIEKQPVQYRAPLYAEIEEKSAGSIHVLYQSAGAVEESKDKEFGGTFSWDIPLLEGYPFEIIKRSSKLVQTTCKYINNYKTDAVLLTDLNSRISQISMVVAILLGKPLWLRMETQDKAFRRTPLKSVFRSIFYKFVYSFFSKALYIGKLNREHYLRHGFSCHQLARVPYIVSNRIKAYSLKEKLLRRQEVREKLSIPQNAKVVSFFGKLISKKNPTLILEASTYLNSEEVHYLFVGSGELESQLKEQSKKLGCSSTFTGFINQSAIHDYYLASDIMCLPSRQMGETWGLTVNEGLQAGCGVICSEFVGSSEEFGSWERVRVCKSEDPISFAENLSELLEFQSDFDWCKEEMNQNYSMESAAYNYTQAMISSGISNKNKVPQPTI